MNSAKVDAAVEHLRRTGRLRLRGRLLPAGVSSACLSTIVLFLITTTVVSAPRAWPLGVATLTMFGGAAASVGAVLATSTAFRRVALARSAVLVDTCGLSVLGVSLSWDDVRGAAVTATSGPESTTIWRSAVGLTPDGLEALHGRGRLSRLGVELDGDCLLLPPIRGLSPREVAAVLQRAVAEYGGVRRTRG